MGAPPPSLPYLIGATSCSAPARLYGMMSRGNGRAFRLMGSTRACQSDHVASQWQNRVRVRTRVLR